MPISSDDPSDVPWCFGCSTKVPTAGRPDGRQGCKGPRPDKDDLGRFGDHHRDLTPRVRLLLLGRRDPRRGDAGHADRQVSGKRLWLGCCSRAARGGRRGRATRIESGAVASRWFRACHPVVHVSERRRSTSGRPHRPAYASSANFADNPLGDPPNVPWRCMCRQATTTNRTALPVGLRHPGLRGVGPMWHNRSPFRPTFPEAVDALFAGGDAPALPRGVRDAWTAYGGASSSTPRGRAGTLVPLRRGRPVRRRPLSHAGLRRAPWIAGKSSGGFGAMITPMLRPDLFGGLASHAGDALYELSYIQGFGKVVRALRAYDGSYERFWEDFASRPPMSKRPTAILSSPTGSRQRSRRTRTAPCTSRSTCRRDDSSTTSGALAGLDPVRMCRARRCPAHPARDLPRRWHPRRVVPGPRGARVPRRARRGRRHGRRLRALRRGARRHRLPLPARPGLPRGAPGQRPMTAGGRRLPCHARCRRAANARSHPSECQLRGDLQASVPAAVRQRLPEIAGPRTHRAPRPLRAGYSCHRLRAASVQDQSPSPNAYGRCIRAYPAQPRPRRPAAARRTPWRRPGTRASDHRTCCCRTRHGDRGQGSSERRACAGSEPTRVPRPKARAQGGRAADARRDQRQPGHERHQHPSHRLAPCVGNHARLCKAAPLTRT